MAGRPGAWLSLRYPRFRRRRATLGGGRSARDHSLCARLWSHPSLEAVLWYQHLFQLERGRECLALHRRDLCRALWKQWSPTWRFDDATFERTAASFDNPDFVDMVVHAYRFSFGTEAGDPAYAKLEDRLATRPKINVPAITLYGTRDPLKAGGTAGHANMFVARHEHRVVDCGHNLPTEAPGAFAAAILTMREWTASPRD